MAKSKLEEAAPASPHCCVICGSQAAGVYYKVRSCDGCRSFFRRMVYRGQRNDACLDRENRTIAECRATTNCKKCRFSLCLMAGMRPWYLREAGDLVFPFPLAIPLAHGSEESDERQFAALLHADVAHENLRLSKCEPIADRDLTLDSLLSAQQLPNHVQNSPGWSVTSSSPGMKLFQLILGHSRNHSQNALKITISDPQNNGPQRKKDRLSADLACSVEYIKAFEFFYALDAESKRSIILRSALVLANFTAVFASSVHRESLTHFYDADGRAIQAMQRISLSVQEASIVKALIICNPAIGGIAPADLPILSAESEAYGRMLFALLLESRGAAAPVVYVEIISLFEILIQQAQKQKSQRLLMSVLGQETVCPLLDEIMMT